MDRETWWNERNINKNASPASGPAANARSRASSPGAKGKHNQSRGNSGGSAFSDDFGGSDDESQAVLPPLSEGVQRLTLSSMDRRFHGKSSGLVLVQAAIDMKREYTGTNVTEPNEGFWDPEVRIPAPDLH